MFVRLQNFFDHQANLATGGHVPEFASAYEFPLPFHLKDNVMVFTTPDSLCVWLGRVFSWLAPQPGEKLSFNVVAVDMPRRGRFRAWVSLQRFDASGNLMGSSKGIYFMRDLGNRLAIEMVHCELGQKEIMEREHLALRKVG